MDDVLENILLAAITGEVLCSGGGVIIGRLDTSEETLSEDSLEENMVQF